MIMYLLCRLVEGAGLLHDINVRLCLTPLGIIWNHNFRLASEALGPNSGHGREKVLTFEDGRPVTMQYQRAIVAITTLLPRPDCAKTAVSLCKIPCTNNL